MPASRRGWPKACAAIMKGSSTIEWQAPFAAPSKIDDALNRVVEGFTSSGVVSAAGNRRAFRVAEEPLDMFRRYMAVYTREQALCHFSTTLITNLERNWNAHNRAV